MWLQHVCKVERAHSSSFANIYMFNSNNGDKWRFMPRFYCSVDNQRTILSHCFCVQVAQWHNNYRRLLLLLFYLHIRVHYFCLRHVVNWKASFAFFSHPVPVVDIPGSLCVICWENWWFLSPLLWRQPFTFSPSLWLKLLARKTSRRAPHSRVKRCMLLKQMAMSC